MPDSLKDIFLAEGNWLVENSKTIARTSAPVFHERDARQAAALAGYVGCLCDNCVDSLVAAKEGSKS
jgi:hypothetical protein